jgi:hypothetical protein
VIRLIPRPAKINPQARERLDWLAGESTADYSDGELFALLSQTPGGNVMRLLGSSIKTEKGEVQQVLTVVLYMAAALSSGYNLCSWATEGCIRACLGHTTGRLQMPSSQRAQVRKALLFKLFPAYFLRRIVAELTLHACEAQALGMQAAARLNGTTDVPWEKYLDTEAIQALGVTLYDYTKAPAKARKAAGYHLTYSVSEAPNSPAEAEEWLSQGGNAALVVAAKGSDKLADAKRVHLAMVGKRWRGCPTHSGEISDVRYRDPAGSLTLLHAKGGALKDRTGFAHRMPL